MQADSAHEDGHTGDGSVGKDGPRSFTVAPLYVHRGPLSYVSVALSIHRKRKRATLFVVVNVERIDQWISEQNANSYEGSRRQHDVQNVYSADNIQPKRNIRDAFVTF